MFAYSLVVTDRTRQVMLVPTTRIMNPRRYQGIQMGFLLKEQETVRVIGTSIDRIDQDANRLVMITMVTGECLTLDGKHNNLQDIRSAIKVNNPVVLQLDHTPDTLITKTMTEINDHIRWLVTNGYSLRDRARHPDRNPLVGVVTLSRSSDRYGMIHHFAIWPVGDTPAVGLQISPEEDRTVQAVGPITYVEKMDDVLVCVGGIPLFSAKGSLPIAGILRWKGELGNNPTFPLVNTFWSDLYYRYQF